MWPWRVGRGDLKCSHDLSQPPEEDSRLSRTEVGQCTAGTEYVCQGFALALCVCGLVSDSEYGVCIKTCTQLLPDSQGFAVKSACLFLSPSQPLAL